MRRIAKLDRQTARRVRALGDIGERLARRILKRAGFMRVANLNRRKAHSPYADLLAEKGRLRYVVSVKIRNKYEYTHDGSRRLNARYKLGARCHEHAATAEREWRANAAWLAICLEPKTYDAYFGLLAELDGGLGIRMSARAVASYRCLARAVRHGFDHAKLQNTYEVVSSNGGQSNFAVHRTGARVARSGR